MVARSVPQGLFSKPVNLELRTHFLSASASKMKMIGFEVKEKRAGYGKGAKRKKG
jgi:hypothetical protein